MEVIALEGDPNSGKTKTLNLEKRRELAYIQLVLKEHRQDLMFWFFRY